MKLFNKIKKWFAFKEQIHIDTSSMTLVSREEFETPLGIGVREVYSQGKRTLEVTCTPTEESIAYKPEQFRLSHVSE